MHEKSPVLTAEARDRPGTRYNNRLRSLGRIPAVVYGRGSEPVSISLDAREAERHIHKGEKIFRLGLPGPKGQDGTLVLLKDLQFDHLGSKIVHADFARVSLTDRIRTRVPIHLIGEAIGLKQAGAILMHPTTELEVECVVTELPEFLEVNISELDVGKGITAADVKLTIASMKMITDKHAMVAQIVIQQEIVVGEATAVEAGAAEPEVLTAKKPAEGEVGAAAAPGAGAKAPAGKDGKPAAGGAGAKPAAGAAGAKPGAGAKPAGGGDKKK